MNVSNDPVEQRSFKVKSKSMSKRKGRMRKIKAESGYPLRTTVLKWQ